MDGTNTEGNLTNETDFSPDESQVGDELERWQRPEANGEPAAPQPAAPPWTNLVPENFNPLVGQVLAGRFEIIQILGSGGMSIVYRAKLTSVDKHVAIKTLNIRLQSRPGVRERFSREIETLAKLEHPHIVTVHDCLYGAAGELYLVMDLLTGKSLDDTLTEEGPMALERVRKIGIQICAAVKYAHQKGVIHRDLKPGNVMLLANEQDFVKVVDFGLVKLGEESRRLTQSGEFWGSPPYVSPEQVKGEPCDARSDVYSLGCVLYEMLVGKDPFFGFELFNLLRKHVNDMPPSFHEVAPDRNIPAEMEGIVFKALAKEPADRFQSMAEFQTALEQLGSGSFSTQRQAIPSISHTVSEQGSTGNRLRDTFLQSGEPSRSSQYLLAVVIIAVIASGAVAYLMFNSASTSGSSAGDSKAPPSAVIQPGTTLDADSAAQLNLPRPVSVRANKTSKFRGATGSEGKNKSRRHASTKRAKNSEPRTTRAAIAPVVKSKMGSQWERLKQRRSSAAQE